MNRNFLNFFISKTTSNLLATQKKANSKEKINKMDSLRNENYTQLINHCAELAIPVEDTTFINRQLKRQVIANEMLEYYGDDEENVSMGYNTKHNCVQIGQIVMRHLPLTRSQKRVMEACKETFHHVTESEYLLINTETKIELEECFVYKMRMPINDETWRTVVFCKLEAETLAMDEEEYGEWYAYVITKTIQSKKHFKCLRTILTAMVEDDEDWFVKYRKDNVFAPSEKLQRTVDYHCFNLDSVAYD